MKHAKEYFDNHSAVDILYFTSDHLAFFDEHNAINHAAQLDDDTITRMTRDEIDEELANLMDENGEEEYDPLDEPDAE
jgi:hypothetical protein